MSEQKDFTDRLFDFAIGLNKLWTLEIDDSEMKRLHKLSELTEAEINEMETKHILKEEKNGNKCK